MKSDIVGNSSEQDGRREDRDYSAAALCLARSYVNLLKEKEYIEKVIGGEEVYTRDDALLELIRTTASTESDTGVRVQTSNISNTTEQIGMLLLNGFVEKKNREMVREVVSDAEGREYLYWKLDVIGTAMSERMDKFERGLLKRHYGMGMTYSEIRSRYKAKKVYNRDISKACKSVLLALEDEIRVREHNSAPLIDRLMKEADEYEK